MKDQMQVLRLRSLAATFAQDDNRFWSLRMTAYFLKRVLSLRHGDSRVKQAHEWE
jgi:hypothetical protein